MSKVTKPIKTQEGFTLIEVMVVLVIIGILAIVMGPVYANYVRKAKVSEAISNVGAYATAARVFRMETGGWPAKGDLQTKIVNVDEKYFKITGWDKTDKTLTIKVTAGDFDDKTAAFNYMLDPNYTGTWTDTGGDVLTTYAPYLGAKKGS